MLRKPGRLASQYAAFIQYGLSRIIMNITSPEYLHDCPVIIILNACIFMSGIALNKNKLLNKVALLIKYTLGMYILHPFIIIVAQKIMPWIQMGWFLRWVILTVTSMTASAILLKIPYVNRLVKL